ncbi:serine hydrolase domain-containing protein [Alteriqipengyuania lutimaris]|uniref:Class C beta-lactamase-related serine hydrolase n=1 Tax=Alteriqipengyuania lutimaris TaxID=1538146 RepID=A0A395LIK1_9SPHN|nr:serine hydrolase [Alteriqipengyuania lutimaris]MBB3034324.1 CubicO group peptidase (beta-lactamase class C family) [Alteriqipengyuania lutimaris]RDS76773.1 class C beta-lactamase-related serine hydrolase [Alteriqipengyuania lutimaris]
MLSPRALLLATPLPLVLSLAACGGGAEPDPGPTEAELAAVEENPGVGRQRLAMEFGDLFEEEQGLGDTRAALVMHAGEIVAERYGEGYDADTRFISWSMAKTVTAVMIGMLVADGALELDAPAPIASWQRPGDARADITLRHLLQMRSGLDHTEGGEVPYESSEVRMLFLDQRDDMATFAEQQPLEAEPGETFEYSSNTTVILADIAANALTGGSDDPEERRIAVDTYLKTRLFGPLGMDSMVPEYDAAGTLIGGSAIHATARDWARFGEFLRNRGSYRGTQLVPRKWIEFMLEPSPPAPFYGGQTWLNTQAGDPQNQLYPIDSPEGIFAAIGHMGQYIVVSPQQRLTIVRLGHSDADQRRALLRQINDVVELYPSP